MGARDDLGGSVTDAPSRPDPLAPDHRSADTAAGRGRPDAPDPTVDHYSAFEESQPAPLPAVPEQKGGRNRRTRPKQPMTASRKASLTFAAVFGAVIGLPMMLAAEIVLVSNGSDSASDTDLEERQSVAFTPSSVAPSAVPTLPATVTSVRVEVQGPDRIADIRLYRSRDSAELDNTALPFSATIPVDSDDAYLTVSADDFGYRGAQPMRCTIFVGDVVVSTSVGTKSVDCKVTDATWQRER
jgi:hypothetical protein